MSKYDLQRRTGDGATVEWTYDNEREAVEQGRRNAESSPGEVWEVVKEDEPLFTLVWSSDD